MSIHHTHWRSIGRDYGWPRDDLRFVVDLWVPHGQDLPEDWLAQIEYIPEFERRFAAQRGVPVRPWPKQKKRLPTQPVDSSA